MRSLADPWICANFSKSTTIRSGAPAWSTILAASPKASALACLLAPNTVFYLPKSRIPDDRKVTYTCMVSTIHPNKTEVNRVYVAVGGNILGYPGATTTNCTSLTTTKYLLNSTISTPDVRFVTLDIKDFY